jgi:hypothetical protein
MLPWSCARDLLPPTAANNSASAQKKALDKSSALRSDNLSSINQS